jgi:outer membrane protein assembly factor BamD (BamD/ComL family)
MNDTGSADVASPTSSALTEARALADAGEHAKASAGFEKLYKDSPRSPFGEEALYNAGEEAFKAEDYFHSNELFEKLLVLFPATNHYPEVLRRQFQVGKLFVEEHAKKPSWFLGIEKTDSAFGIELLEKFVKLRDQNELAPQALYLVGEAHLRSDDPELAIESWQRLVREYPRTSWARLGEYRIALAFISLSYGADYDKRPLLTGKKRLDAYIRKYPTGDNIQEAKLKYDELCELLAQHDLATAKKYASRSKYRAAQIYLASVQREYKGTKAAAEAKDLAAAWDNPPDPKAPDEK